MGRNAVHRVAVVRRNYFMTCHEMCRERVGCQLMHAGPAGIATPGQGWHHARLRATEPDRGCADGRGHMWTRMRMHLAAWTCTNHSCIAASEWTMRHSGDDRARA